MSLQSGLSKAVKDVSAQNPKDQRVTVKLTCIVNAVLPTPPSPSTTNLYNVILPAILQIRAERA